jgi:hypothetical protein
MKKTVMAVLINSKKAEIPRVQEILGEYGHIVKTRLGIHDAVIDRKSSCAFLIIELVGTGRQQKAFEKELKKQKGVSVRMMTITVK